MNKPVKLTVEFNVASVKKGETFEIEMVGGGFVGETWTLSVVSGHAKFLSKKSVSEHGGGCSDVFERSVFRAQEKGDIEIVARGKFASPVKFRINVT